MAFPPNPTCPDEPPVGEPAGEHAIDDIDELVDHELTLPQWAGAYELYATCSKCKKGWHGLVRDGCPGLTGIVGNAAKIPPGYL